MWKKYNGAFVIESTNNGVPLLMNIYFLKSLVFSHEKYMISFVLSVLSCYITCIAQIFHVNCIFKTKLMVGVPSLTHIPIDI